jgi:hypothetical protein
VKCEYFISPVLAAICLLGCSGKPATSTTTSIPRSGFPDRAFLYTQDRLPQRKAQLSAEEVRYDISYLVAVLDRAYSGRDHLPAGVYEKLVRRLQALGDVPPGGAEGCRGDLFCQKIAEIFWEVPDNHLYTHSLFDRQLRPRSTDVGENVFHGTGYFVCARTVAGRRVGVLSLGSVMRSKDDQEWKGFEEKIAEISKQTDALVLDLRGNGGGMSDNIRWLASYLYGNPAKMADEIIHMRRSAAADALFFNEAALDILEAKGEGKPIQPYLLGEQQHFLASCKNQEGQKPTWEKEVRAGSSAPFDPRKGYDKPLRILIDGHTASAAEGGFARFLSHPHVKTFGANTGGFIHYGDTEPLVLPNSGIIVSIPTTFREFSDGRFLEKVGYTPDVHVPDGKDALEIALEDLAQRWR